MLLPRVRDRRGHRLLLDRRERHLARHERLRGTRHDRLPGGQPRRTARDGPCRERLRMQVRGFALVRAIGLSAPWLRRSSTAPTSREPSAPWLFQRRCANTIVSAGLEALDMPGREPGPDRGHRGDRDRPADLPSPVGHRRGGRDLLGGLRGDVPHSTHLLRRTRTVSLRSALHPQPAARDTRALVRQITVKAGAARGGA